jgi:hypothetical protein
MWNRPQIQVRDVWAIVDRPYRSSQCVIADIDPLLADTHAFEELRLLSQLRSRPTTLSEDEMASLRRIIGGSGADAASRLGLQRDAPTTVRGRHSPRLNAGGAVPTARSTTRSPPACRAVVRSAEALVAE